jgi:hypothetical protein
VLENNICDCHIIMCVLPWEVKDPIYHGDMVTLRLTVTSQGDMVVMGSTVMVVRVTCHIRKGGVVTCHQGHVSHK